MRNIGGQIFRSQKAYEAYLELEDKQIGEQRKREAESDQRVDEQLKTEKSEAEQLFEVFKDDPVAVHLLKAFLMVHQERRMFDQRVSEADETMYSLEERWSRKAADLRRQAQDAERQAEDEHRRVNDLEDDLSKVKKQIKSQAW